MLGEVRAPRGEAHHANVLQVASEMRETPGLVLLHQRERFVESRQDVFGADVRPCVVHHDVEPAYVPNVERSSRETGEEKLDPIGDAHLVW